VPDTVTIPYPRAWTNDGVFFSATTGSGDTLNLWHMSVDTTGRPTGAPVRLTQGTTLDTRFAVAGDGRVVRAAPTSVSAHFGFPLGTAGLPTGQPRKLHDDSSPTGRSAISADGRILIFPRYDVASGILWAKDLRTGEERQLVATPRTPLNPVISGDGKWVAYTLTNVQTGGNAGLGDGYVLETTGGVPRKMCDNCEAVAWTTDGQLVFDTGGRKTLERVSLKTGERYPLIDSSASVDRPLFGPNGTWMIFNMEGRIVRAPVHPDRGSAESEWTTILTTTSPTERTAGLSPDGGLLDVLLEQDGFRCAYGLRLNRDTGRPQGEPFSGVHVHDASLRWSGTGYGSAVAAGVLVADIYESRGNIWTSQLVRQPQGESRPIASSSEKRLQADGSSLRPATRAGLCRLRASGRTDKTPSLASCSTGLSLITF
jgi:hypothetical protein